MSTCPLFLHYSSTRSLTHSSINVLFPKFRSFPYYLCHLPYPIQPVSLFTSSFFFIWLFYLNSFCLSLSNSLIKYINDNNIVAHVSPKTLSHTTIVSIQLSSVHFSFCIQEVDSFWTQWSSTPDILGIYDSKSHTHPGEENLEARWNQWER